VLPYSPRRRETGWPRGDDDGSIDSRMKPVRIQSVPCMGKLLRVTSFPMEHTPQRREPLLVDSFADNVAGLFAVEREPFSMTSDLPRRGF